MSESEARLLASARHLLGAVEAALDYIEEYEDIVDGYDGRPQPNAAMSLANTLRAVILEATGRRP